MISCFSNRKQMHIIHKYNLIQAPEVIYGESVEEQALRKEQDRAKEDMRKRHESEHKQIAYNLETDARFVIPIFSLKFFIVYIQKVLHENQFIHLTR